MMHSQSPVRNKCFKNQTSLPLVRSLLSQKFSPLLAHAHIKPKKMPKPPPEIMLCNECRAEGVSETFKHTKI